MSARYLPSARTAVSKLRRGLDELIQRADDKTLDIEVRSDLARYACVCVAGFLEQSLLHCGHAVIHRLSHAAARNYAESHLKRSFNPRAREIVRYVAKFDLEWGKTLGEWMDETERGHTINALIGIRNQIAHGNSQSTTIGRVREYRRVVDALVDLLLDLFEPQVGATPGQVVVGA